jgi:acyl carrier protein
VKIRGYRIEPGEIESTLQAHRDVDAAVVLAKNNTRGEKELAAYFTGRETLSTSALRLWLTRTLPAYMVPAHFVQLAAFPLNPNGKVDRKQLPDPEGFGIASGVEYVAPGNETEERLVAIWQEILGKDNIGISNNFFDLGGHSLNATRLISKIKKEFETEITMREFFEDPVISVLADKINNNRWLQGALVEDDSNYNEIKI